MVVAGPALPEGQGIRIERLTKKFGVITAVDDLSFDVAPGRVTGFLGPNGAGKTTTLRCLLGLVTPTSGTTSILGAPYPDLSRPTATVGAALESSAFHPGRTARNHLRTLCLAAGLSTRRADECLALVGLGESARRRVGEFSLGMRQRLALAGALLGDPDVLVLDEPANGLDPAGIAWLRGFLRAFAGSGRTVLVSSHALAEVSATVDDVVIITSGRLVHAGPLDSLLAATDSFVTVVSPRAQELAALLPGAHVELRAPTELVVRGASAAEIGAAAFRGGIELHLLSESRTDLEGVFLRLTSDSGAGT